MFPNIHLNRAAAHVNGSVCVDFPEALPCRCLSRERKCLQSNYAVSEVPVNDHILHYTVVFNVSLM